MDEEIKLITELRETLAYVLNTMDKSEDWWIDCPNKGGFDRPKIFEAMVKADMYLTIRFVRSVVNNNTDVPQ